MIREKLREKQTDSSIRKIFVFKEIFDKNELLEYFRIRYMVYSRVKYIETNDDKMDIDAWDMYSRFFAVFEKESGRIIGTFRFIYKDLKCECLDTLTEIIGSLKDKRFKTMSRSCKFPLIQAFDIDGFLEECYSTNRKIVETSRLTVLPSHWKHGIALTLAQFAIGQALRHRLDDCIIAVHPDHSPMYERLGFRVLPGTRNVIYPGINNHAIVMHINTSGIQEPYRSKALEIKKSILERQYFESTG